MVPRPLRIAFLVDGFSVGGTELNAVRTAESMDRARYELTVLGMSRRGPLLARYEAAGIPLVDFSFRGLRHPDTFLMAPRLVRWLRANRIDVLHCHDKYSNMFGAACGRAARVPLVIASRRFENHGEWRFEVGNNLAYRMAHRVLANSDGIRGLLEREGIAPAKIAVVPNFLDDAAFSPADPAHGAAFRAELGVPEDALVVGCVARLVAVKDHATLIQGFAEVARSEPRAVLVLVGDGDRREALERQAAELGVGHAVRFAGWRSNSVNIHQWFDVSTLSSVSEGFPNTVIEGMAAARPVVSTDVGAVRDAVVDGETGYVVPPRDPGAFVTALRSLLADAGRRQAFGAAGRARALARYRRESVLATLYGLWEEGRRAPRGAASAPAVPAPSARD